MLDDKDVNQFRSLSFAPGEGQRPLNLFQDRDAEYLSFPTIYCGERMNTQVVTVWDKNCSLWTIVLRDAP